MPLNTGLVRITPNTDQFKDVSLETSSGIIYLVGRNAAGKSRFLHALASGAAKISVNVKSPAKTEAISQVPYAFMPWGRRSHDATTFEADHQDEFNQLSRLLERIGQRPIEFSRGKPKKDRVQENGRWVIREQTILLPHLGAMEFTDLSQLSQGTIALDKMLHWLPNFAAPGRTYYGGGQKAPSNITPVLVIVGLEEPETNLHPDVQKRFPLELSRWIKAHCTKVSQRVLVIITTHSPFILRGSVDAEENQRVYGLENDNGSCKLIDLSGRESEEIAVKGVPPRQAILRANEMLGAGIGDLLPAPIILAEGTVQRFLERAAPMFGVESDWFVINPNGDGDLDKRIGSIQALARLLQRVSKTKPDHELFRLHLHIVLDDQQKAEEIRAKFPTDPSRLVVEVHSLGTKQLEDIYPEEILAQHWSQHYPGNDAWDRASSINQYMAEKLGIAGAEIGKAKVALADFVIDKIETREALVASMPALAELIETLLARSMKSA